VTRHGDFIGSGWGFPASVTPAGSVRLISGGEEIDAAIRMILSTIPGERVMRPQFGCRIWSLVFAPLTAGTLGLIEQYVREALERWEPRIDLDQVVATADQETAQVTIELDYRLRSTNDVRNLVFPFYSIPGEGGVA
jgi:phage baseplate assembly protein W